MLLKIKERIILFEFSIKGPGIYVFEEIIKKQNRLTE